MSHRLAVWVLFIVSLIFLSDVNTSYALSAKDVYQKVSGSIYTLYSVDKASKKVKARGSAVAVSSNILATNCHVALAGDYLVVKMHDAEKNKRGRLTYQNKKKDLCLVKVAGAQFNPVKLRYTGDVAIGEEVFAIGNPKGTEKTLSKGIISNKHKVSGGYYLQTDAAIYFGSSGGGLFDDQGNLIGITTKMGGHFGLAIPSEWIVQVVYPGRIKTAVNDDELESDFASESKLMPERRGLYHLGSYGKNDVALYRNNSACFLIMEGKSDNGLVKSTALWNPKFSKTLVIFPSSPTAKEAMQEVTKSHLDKKTKKQKTYRSRSTAMFGKGEYPLFGSKTEDQKYAFVVVRFKENPEILFKNLNDFTANFEDSDSRLGSYSITFGLDGFSKAVSDLESQCSQ